MSPWKETTSNELADLVIDSKELKRYMDSEGKVVGPSVQRALSRAQANIGADDNLKRCTECGGAYLVPINNPFGMQKFGKDDGRCWNCKGCYDDPDQFIAAPGNE